MSIELFWACYLFFMSCAWWPITMLTIHSISFFRAHHFLLRYFERILLRWYNRQLKVLIFLGLQWRRKRYFFKSFNIESYNLSEPILLTALSRRRSACASDISFNIFLGRISIDTICFLSFCWDRWFEAEAQLWALVSNFAFKMFYWLNHTLDCWLRPWGKIRRYFEGSLWRFLGLKAIIVLVIVKFFIMLCFFLLTPLRFKGHFDHGFI